MVFEEFIRSTQKPRIALLGVEQSQIFEWDSDLLGWQLRLENREQLHAENPAVAARSLLGLCSASRYVAKRYLDRPDGTINPPYHDAALMGLGLSLASDAYWVQDDLVRFVEGLQGLPAGSTPSLFDLGDMESIMISFNAFEEIIDAASHPDEIIYVRTARLSLLPFELFAFFRGRRNWIIMVDVPRRHLSWDQIRVVGMEDPALLGMGDEDLRVRCLSLFQRYSALHDIHARLYMGQSWAIDQSESSDDEDSLSDGDQPTRIWPELSFAFLKS